MRKVYAAALMLGVLLTATQLPAQQGTEPGPEHKEFKQLEGKWDATVKSHGHESKGSATFKVGLGGLWVLEHFKGEFGDKSFEGRGATSYDPHKKKYTNVWIDSMSPVPMVSEGTYDKDTKTLTLVGNMTLPDGKTMKATMTSVEKDADTRTFTLQADVGGKEVEMMHITYKRHK